MNANYKLERTENGTYLVKIEKGKTCTFTIFNKRTKEVEVQRFDYFEDITFKINEQKAYYKAIGYKVIDVTKENVTTKSSILCDDIIAGWRTEV